MKRIIMIVCKMLFLIPHYLIGMNRLGKRKDYDINASYEFIKGGVKRLVKAGRVTIETVGMENIPNEDGFIFFPNHQGMFDVFVFIHSCPRPFSFVIKKEAKDIPVVKQAMCALKAIAIDREDIRQSMKVITQVTEEVKKGRNFLIFAEGTRSKLGNRLLPFKGGTFKSAMKAKCPIVPCALIDSYKPFDEKSTKPVTVKLVYLPPIRYEEYVDMKTVEIADMVKARIEAAIAEYN